MSDDGKWKHAFKPGGVMRCCIASISEKGEPDHPTDSEIIDCKYCSDGLQFVDGAWQARWIKEGHRD